MSIVTPLVKASGDYYDWVMKEGLFSAAFGDFPGPVDAEAASYGYFRMRVFVLRPTGHSAIEFESEVRGHPPIRAESHFFIPALPADLNRMGSEMIAWLISPDKPLRVEFRDS